MVDALGDRWMPRSRVNMFRQRAADRCSEEKRAAAQAAAEPEARRALPGYDGDCPDRMQGALRFR